MLEHSDWFSIEREIDRQVRASSSPVFAQGEVIKADASRNLVWLKEFGNQPIPLFVFNYEVKYYDTVPTGIDSNNQITTQLRVKKAIVKPMCPKVGDIVLVAKQFGSRRLPKCLGVLRSVDFEAISEDV